MEDLEVSFASQGKGLTVAVFPGIFLISVRKCSVSVHFWHYFEKLNMLQMGDISSVLVYDYAVVLCLSVCLSVCLCVYVCV